MSKKKKDRPEIPETEVLSKEQLEKVLEPISEEVTESLSSIENEKPPVTEEKGEPPKTWMTPVIAIILAVLIPIAGLIYSIICITTEKQEESKRNLYIIAIVLSVVFSVVYYLIYSKMM